MRDTFTIKTETGEDTFLVKGGIWPVFQHYCITDMAGDVKATIRQRLSLLVPKYDVFIGGTKRATVKRRLTLGASYSINGIDWEVIGDVPAHNYRMSDLNGNVIMHLTKKKNVWGDNYEVDIANSKDELLSLCIALSIEMATLLLRQMRDS